MGVNLNKLANKITRKEGGKKSISVAQVKETMKLFGKELARMTLPDLTEVIRKYK